ncbi:hypothetical protein B296_00028932 [Ensete ventricosum]|uniref:Uncharacterized protein n=1 Tax=Ensete ventricosum TaxID=4639 RepID=A0A426ZKP5_ENSVE|nr:hypothetical protein B296_00028932 [Ensete ventricosum]
MLPVCGIAYVGAVTACTQRCKHASPLVRRPLHTVASTGGIATSSRPCTLPTHRWLPPPIGNLPMGVTLITKSAHHTTSPSAASDATRIRRTILRDSILSLTV